MWISRDEHKVVGWRSAQVTSQLPSDAMQHSSLENGESRRQRSSLHAVTKSRQWSAGGHVSLLRMSDPH